MAEKALKNRGSSATADVAGYRVPYRVFTDPDYYRREQENIFQGETWSFVALEAEVPEPGDFKSTFIGETPVIVTRGSDGKVHVVVNRCAHRGALVCREMRGNRPSLECVYHQWAYDLEGNLIGVPFRRGLKGQGGMPGDFDMKEHGLRKLRVDSVGGLVFASFSETVEPLRDFLGPIVIEHIERIMCKPIKVLGDQRQHVHGNWKLYAENTRDPYHASLLHLFHNTFGLYRSTQTGKSVMDANKRHSLLYSIAASNDDAADKQAYGDSRTFDTEFKLQDMSLLKGRQEFDDGVTLVILAVFPNLVLQQIQNTLAVRQTVTKGTDGFELVWTHFGYADDDVEMQAIRQKQANLIGPAGLVSMEDGEAVEIVQRAVIGEHDAASYIAMGGDRPDDADHLVTEGAIIGFWHNYEKLVGFGIAP
ncbi:MAG: Rieske (2Fe-2S) protein [Hyphomonas sp. BRH_c22]|uniref:Large terminal subunit of phenylpropionate dioxygenase n=1 Tax=Hyphomonas oceanitis SCH89 TaxID=1280953 RepID=A0A059G2S1_9PROT|nr:MULTISPECIES: Rieske 2Fe-2S domain-containing protein [Hyphomonadaceae]KDA01162.1 large terminal subunit of phenylpropionate dioxygenase [Hyphomonas oceanitis SCH89]KJS38353.1 MAG: Rieske (2Fe-2S) protein [Hyphomonas sp. BRH_c22]RIJ16680.1 Rieske (2Fe-2S) protein [Henriciella mobilis]RIJ21539.1 Rieske (2Fe-2S) protein [Henriciella mobilis]|tara:strand:- start:1143 stop:2405 length:1263 start_codon:yes stop_codon:yes gene_type:complete